MEQFCKLIRFEFGTLSRGLSDPSRKETLDHMFLLLLEDLLSLEESVGVGQSPTTGGHVPPFTPSTSLNLGAFTDLKSRLSFGAANLLVLRDNFAKIQIEMCLNELQSGDFGDNDSDCEDCLMLYNIIGCSIFYKNRLVLSHLDAESSECVFLYVERHRLLHLVDKEPVSQLVLWQKVYLPLPEEDHLSNKDIDHYLLIVGMNNFLLATLVESGNVTELMDKDAGPDPFLVDQAETTLYHLHSLHVQVACEESLVSSPIESILSTAKGNSSINKKSNKSGGKVPPNLEGSPTRSPDVPSILKQKSSPTFEPRESPTCDCERSWGEGSDDSHSHSPHSRDASLVEDDDEGGGGGGEKSEIDEDRSSSRADTSSDSDWRIAKGCENRGSYTNKNDGFKGMSPHSLRVTVGEENVLFHLLQLDVGEGVIITPYFGDGEIPRLHSELVRNFHSVVSHIRHVLHAGQRNKNASGNYVGSSVLDSTKEFGIYFECPDQSKNNKAVLSYWVIGRLFGAPYEREVYVALEDSVPQNLQEIAFKIALEC
ncbi:UNVERIFIED_CONTAM: hypothetical protein RMT77_016770 [Armadillidium vulgare]